MDDLSTKDVPVALITLLYFLDLFEVIFKCLSTTNDQVYQEAER